MLYVTDFIKPALIETERLPSSSVITKTALFLWNVVLLKLNARTLDLFTLLVYSGHSREDKQLMCCKAHSVWVNTVRWICSRRSNVHLILAKIYQTRENVMITSTLLQDEHTCSIWFFFLSNIELGFPRYDWLSFLVVL